MPDRLSLHAPVLVNTIGHCAGAIIFGILLYLFILDWRRDARDRSALPSIAAALALLWNIGSLIGIATPAAGDAVVDAIVAASFSVLSLLPAVLLHISVRSRESLLWITGYVVSGIAVALHVGDLITSAPRFHYAALLLVTIGFGVLTAISVAREAVSGKRDGSGARLAGAMVLFLFAVSFVHFETANHSMPWSGEAALHHAGIPLALFVLLQDYRFLLLDAFIRFLLNAVMAALTVMGALYAYATFLRAARGEADDFRAALVFSGASLLLILFAWARTRAQRWLTRVVFLRASAERAALDLRNLAGSVSGELQYLDAAAGRIAGFVSARRFELMNVHAEAPETATIVNGAAAGVPAWVQAIVPLRFARGDSRMLLLGARAGRRRYLSEDIEALERLAAIVFEQVDRLREVEMQRLVSQAELRTLQAQINPHFFFNALNTLYGAIHRENAEARALVSSLANLFRYSLAANSAFIRIEEELTIVRAYLEIEQLRLGSKLLTKMEIEESTLAAEVPVLSIQPLVENAIKHGVSSRPEGGFVKIAIRHLPIGVTVEVSNSGAFAPPSSRLNGVGIGLENVRKRLWLCYGEKSSISIESGPATTTVRFSVPATHQSRAAAMAGVAHLPPS